MLKNKIIKKGQNGINNVMGKVSPYVEPVSQVAPLLDTIPGVDDKLNKKFLNSKYATDLNIGNQGAQNISSKIEDTLISTNNPKAMATGMILKGARAGSRAIESSYTDEYGRSSNDTRTNIKRAMGKGLDPIGNIIGFQDVFNEKLSNEERLNAGLSAIPGVSTFTSLMGLGVDQKNNRINKAKLKFDQTNISKKVNPLLNMQSSISNNNVANKNQFFYKNGGIINQLKKHYK
jgi:hypothetical protein